MIKEKAILALQNAIDDDHASDSLAIKRVLKLMRKYGISPDGTKSKKIAAKPSTQAADNNGAEQRVITAIGTMNGEFTLANLMEAVQAANQDLEINRSTVSSVLFRNKDKLVKVVQTGRGRKAAIYEKISLPAQG